jgi:hypothetical protein
MRKYNTLSNKTKEELQQIANSVISLSAFLRELGLKSDGGGSYTTAKKHLQKLNINTSHWKGQGWNKNNQNKNWTELITPSSVKKRLLKIREYFCDSCKLISWCDKPITLELHHVDGDATNNAFENLELLCPNCHSQTPNFKNRKRTNGT